MCSVIQPSSGMYVCRSKSNVIATTTTTTASSIVAAAAAAALCSKSNEERTGKGRKDPGMGENQFPSHKEIPFKVFKKCRSIKNTQEPKV